MHDTFTSSRDEIISFLHDFPRGKGSENYAEGYMIGWDVGGDPRITLRPMSDEKISSLVQRSFSSVDIIKVHAFVGECGQWVPTMQFLQWCPAGLDRFFAIDPIMNKWFQELFFDKLRSYSASGGLFAAILNANLAELAPVEIASILSYHKSGPYLIFSRGSFRGGNDKSVNTWRTKLEERQYQEHFGTTPEHDPILREILVHLKGPWD